MPKTKTPTGRRLHITAVVPGKLKAAIAALAIETGQSKSSTIASLIALSIDRLPKGKSARTVEIVRGQGLATK